MYFPFFALRPKTFQSLSLDEEGKKIARHANLGTAWRMAEGRRRSPAESRGGIPAEVD